MPPPIPAHVALYVVALLPPSLMTAFYLRNAPDEKEIEEKLMDRYKRDISITRANNDELSKVFEMAFKQGQGKQEFHATQLDSMLKAGKDKQDRLHAVDKDLYGTQRGQEVKEKLVEEQRLIQEEKEKKKKKKKRKKKKSKIDSEQENIILEKDNLSATSVTSKKDDDEEEKKEPQEKELLKKGTSEESETSQSKTKKKRKKFSKIEAHKKSNDLLLPAAVTDFETSPVEKSKKVITSLNNTIDIQTAVAVASMVSMAAVLGFLAGNNKRT